MLPSDIRFGVPFSVALNSLDLWFEAFACWWMHSWFFNPFLAKLEVEIGPLED